MKIYEVEVSWTTSAAVLVSAKDEEEACRLVEETSRDVPLEPDSKHVAVAYKAKLAWDR